MPPELFGLMVVTLITFILMWMWWTGRSPGLAHRGNGPRLLDVEDLDPRGSSAAESGRATRFNRLRRKLEAAGLRSISPLEFQLASILSGVAVGVTVLVLTRGTLLALCGGILGLYMPTWVINRKVAGMKERLDAQLEMVARTIAYQSEMGNSLIQIIESVSEMDPPIGPYFVRILTDVRAGIPMAEALIRVRDHMAHPGMDLLSVPLLVHLENGTSLADPLLHISAIMRSQMTLQADIRGKFSQPQASYLFVTGLSIPFLAFWFVQRPDLAIPLYSSPLGQLLLLILTAWAYTGYRIMKRLATLQAAL
jgi:tight adherence protein B